MFQEPDTNLLEDLWTVDSTQTVKNLPDGTFSTGAGGAKHIKEKIPFFSCSWMVFFRLWKRAQNVLVPMVSVCSRSRMDGGNERIGGTPPYSFFFSQTDWENVKSLTSFNSLFLQLLFSEPRLTVCPGKCPSRVSVCYKLTPFPNIHNRYV